MKRLTIKRGDAPASSDQAVALSRRILHHASRGARKIEFLTEASRALIESSGCDAVEMWLGHGDRHYRFELARDHAKPIHFEILPSSRETTGRFVPCPQDDDGVGALCRDLLTGHLAPDQPCMTENGSHLLGDLPRRHVCRLAGGGRKTWTLDIGVGFRSLLAIPFVIDPKETGVLLMKCRAPAFFSHADATLYEGLAQTVGIAVDDRRAQEALRERIKELTCLYEVSGLAARTDLSIDEVLTRIAAALPAAWQYPESAHGRIVLDGREFMSPGHAGGRQRQTAAIVFGGARRGTVEICYSEEMPEIDDEGPFLKEERNLIEGIAREAALIVERRRSADERERLQEQLRHADRLATIGQLAAGVAHELNEPLGSVLGFAQLMLKAPDLREQARRDTGKIVESSLHAREIIKKLLLFARQTPPQKSQVDLNALVDEGLYFMAARCAKEGISIVRDLAAGLPEITADASQLRQVFINLVVNAVQSMGTGGKLSIATKRSGGMAVISVSDTGTGMTPETMRQIFVPFFTTKEIGQGTGLGLSVVHGIVTAHGGDIRVQSEPGRGSCFEVLLPLGEKTCTEERADDRNGKRRTGARRGRHPRHP
jgi:signal transduction histidine kinase